MPHKPLERIAIEVRFGQELRRLRRTQGLTQAQLAERTGLYLSQIGRIERGGTCPTLRTAERLLQALGASLLSDERPPTAKLRRR